ncbi:1-acyl-sn-glycerol-3-phosphate acyltransferase beta-like isoform X2 [Homalodisca vitripennis]|uniref:1-acyl-sn-glycerol-3-phosphate acyltransferase n=1 Tax=Homalodisca liturata TaxID=320908 RepID=A0A1B6IKJ6_9HEMI|nr:1-acyl-sn-glycerol-3-phosphate acyltransferase beta-like isoform X2 [Homalodisca vitripennis]
MLGKILYLSQFVSDCLYLFVLFKSGMLVMSLPTELLGGAVLVFIVCLFSASHVFRYYTKFIIFILLSMVSATVFIPIMLLRPRDYRNALMPAWGARQVSRLLGLKWEMQGKDNIVKDSGCVVVINHQSGLDLLVLAEIWPVMQRCTVISKQEIFYLWPFGLAAWLWGTIFINRLNNEQAQSAINKTGETIRTKQARLCMFPEGTRHGGKDLLPFKKGAFHVAIASQTPVQPVVVSQYHFLDSENHIFNSGKSVIKILPPIPTEGLTKSDLESLIARTHSIMSEEFTKLSAEVLLQATK